MEKDFDSDISLKEVILTIFDYVKAIFKSWLWVGITALAFGLLLFYFAFKSPEKYNASLTFMLNEDERGGLSGLSGILGQFGLGAGSSESNFDKIIDLSKTRRISQNAIFDSVLINPNKTYLANHFIQNMEENELWYRSSSLGSEDSLSLEGFRFTHDDLESFTQLENKALKRVHALIVGDDKIKGVLIPYYNELTGIMSLDVNTTNEDLSIQLVNKLYTSLSQYYIDKATEKQKYDYDIIKEKYDSINIALSSVQYSLAAFEDSNTDLYRKKDILRRGQLNTEKQKLQYMSGKAEEQLQLAQLSLENKTPYINVIDYPLKPLKPEKKSPFVFFILGLLIGGFLASAFVVLKKAYKKIMA